MAQTIRHKRSSIPDRVPTATQLELGEIAINTATGCLYIKKSDNKVVRICNHNGNVTLDSDLTIGGDLTINGRSLADWISGSPGQFDWQDWDFAAQSNAHPTLRSDGVSALVDGDQYWDPTINKLWVYDGTTWQSAGGQFDWQTNTLTPVLASAVAGVSRVVDERADGGTLVTGDQYWDSQNKLLYVYDGVAPAGWDVISNTGADIQAGTGDPNDPNGDGTFTDSIALKSNGEAINPGDLYYDVDNNVLYAYDSDGATAGEKWTVAGGGGLVIADAAPTNPKDGDLWYDSNTASPGAGRTYAWSDDVTAWVDIAPAAASTTIVVSDTAPTTPSGGDGWLDTGTTGNLFIWDVSSSAWVQASNMQVYATSTIGTTPPTNPRDGDIFRDTDEDITYIYMSATVQWVPV